MEKEVLGSCFYWCTVAYGDVTEKRIQVFVVHGTHSASRIQDPRACRGHRLQILLLGWPVRRLLMPFSQDLVWYRHDKNALWVSIVSYLMWASGCICFSARCERLSSRKLGLLAENWKQNVWQIQTLNELLISNLEGLGHQRSETIGAVANNFEDLSDSLWIGAS